MFNSTQIIGITAAVFTALSMIPQLIKVIKEKKAGNVSILMIVVLMIGLLLWIWYGINKQDYPIIGTNVFSFIINSILIFFAVRYKHTNA